jgi:hypothetical protein
VRGDLPIGTVTLLFTDVEGSTKLLEEIGDESYDKALAEHRRLIRAACAAHGGVEVDTQGDAFFFAFSTAPGALAAASEVTRALASGPIQVRIGLHTGKPRLSDEGYVGKEVHFAARLAATGHGGQIVLSKATAELVDGSLTELGEHRLKDIAESVPIYQLGEERFPPLKTISNTNLPRPASSFVGRERELEEVLTRSPRERACSPSPVPAALGRLGSRSRRRPRSSPTTKRASSGSGSPSYAIPFSSPRRSRRPWAPRTASPSTSASARCSSSSTTWSR